MARIDRIFARATGAPRKVNNRQKQRLVWDGLARKFDWQRVPFHVPGAKWWRNKVPDIAERGLRSTSTRRGAFETRREKRARVEAT